MEALKSNVHVLIQSVYKYEDWLLKSKDSDFRITEVKLKSDLGDFTKNDGIGYFDCQECIEYTILSEIHKHDKSQSVLMSSNCC